MASSGAPGVPPSARAGAESATTEGETAGIALAPEPAGQADATPGLVAAAAKAVAELDAIKPFWR